MSVIGSNTSLVAHPTADIAVRPTASTLLIGIASTERQNRWARISFVIVWLHNTFRLIELQLLLNLGTF